MSNLAYQILVIGCGILLAGAYSGFETGNYMLNRVRLQFRMDQGWRRAHVLDSALSDPQRFIFSMLVGHNLSVYIASVTATAMFAAMIDADHPRLILGFLPWTPDIAATMTLTPLFFIFAEVGPKDLFRTRSNSLMYAAADLLRVSNWVFYPVTGPLRALARVLTRRESSSGKGELEGISRQRLRIYFTEGTTEGVLTGHQNKMVDNVLAMRSTPVTSAMIPIKQAVTASQEANVKEFMRLVRGKDISRVAVYDGDVHNIVGLVHIFDLMGASPKPDDPLKPLTRKVLKVSDQATLQSAFYELQRQKQPIASVVTADGKALGLITLEDIAAQIAGKRQSPAAS
jgi:putative hemolysin